jgi:hypothetical protein
MVVAPARAARPVRRIAPALLAPLLALLAAAGVWADERPGGPSAAARTTAQLDSRYRMNEHELVVIEDHALKPPVVKLAEGQLVAWISYASVPSEIVFSREVARSMICHSLVNFAIRDEQLRSAPIHTGEFASFCELKPGRYRYRVVRPKPSEESAESAGTLEGEILVGSPAGT